VGQLTSDGVLYIDVSGLVLVSTLMNPAANFRGLVSCQSIDDKGEVATVNVSTDNFSRRYGREFDNLGCHQIAGSMLCTDHFRHLSGWVVVRHYGL